MWGVLFVCLVGFWLVGLGFLTVEVLFLCLYVFNFKSMSPLMFRVAEREARTLSTAQAVKPAPQPQTQDTGDSLHSCRPATPSGRVFPREPRVSSPGPAIAQAQTAPMAGRALPAPHHEAAPPALGERDGTAPARGERGEGRRGGV